MTGSPAVGPGEEVGVIGDLLDWMLDRLVGELELRPFVIEVSEVMRDLQYGRAPKPDPHP